MRWNSTAAAVTLIGLVTACGGSEPDDAADSSVIERSPGPVERGDRPMPMGDRMGEMHDRMMGGEAGEAPAATPASASAPGCPDIDGELVDRGREVFGGAGACYTCHGGDAAGSQLGPDLTDGEWLNVEGAYASIANVVRMGVSDPVRYPAPMPPMGGASLSEAEVCAVAGYVYSLSR